MLRHLIRLVQATCADGSCSTTESLFHFDLKSQTFKDPGGVSWGRGDSTEQRDSDGLTLPSSGSSNRSAVLHGFWIIGLGKTALLANTTKKRQLIHMQTTSSGHSLDSPTPKNPACFPLCQTWLSQMTFQSSGVPHESFGLIE